MEAISSLASSMNSSTNCGSTASGSAGPDHRMGRRLRAQWCAPERWSPPESSFEGLALGVAARRCSTFGTRDGAICVQRLDAHLGVVEHVPGIGAAVLQGLHVVLDADDGIGHCAPGAARRAPAPRLDQLAHLRADRIHQLHRPALAEHQQAGGDAAQQLRHVVEPLRRRTRSAFARRSKRLP